MDQIIYVCVVGTGTAGKHSNVMAGISFAIRRRMPDYCYLVPSSSEDSMTCANLVAEEVGKITKTEIMPVSNPDDINICRGEIKKIIIQAQCAHPGAKVVLNPTSGTKQMTTAAVLAAVETGLQDIDYIGGERDSGVVKTGSEKMLNISLRPVFAHRALESALTLHKGMSDFEAVKLLTPYQDFYPKTIALLRALAARDHFDYVNALNVADALPGGKSSALATATRELLNAKDVSLPRAADILCFVERCIESGRPEEALANLYRCVELFCKLKLQEYGVDEGATMETISGEFDVKGALRTKIMAELEGDDGFNPGMATAFKLLRVRHGLDFELCRMVFDDKKTWHRLQFRQQTRYGHGVKPADQKTVEALASVVKSAAVTDWPELAELITKHRFPKLEDIVKEEMDNA